eukprot:COSAG01_NODE_2492_length_7583_cov_4.761491_1_plen_43_part_10
MACWASQGAASLSRAARRPADQRFMQGTSEVDLCFQRMILDTP